MNDIFAISADQSRTAMDTFLIPIIIIIIVHALIFSKLEFYPTKFMYNSTDIIRSYFSFFISLYTTSTLPALSTFLLLFMVYAHCIKIFFFPINSMLTIPCHITFFSVLFYFVSFYSRIYRNIFRCPLIPNSCAPLSL